jgi:O-antigen ligase
VAFAPTRSQLTAAATAVVAGLAAAIFSSVFRGVAVLSGDIGARERDGAIMLVILVVLGTGAALVTLWRARAQRSAPQDDLLPGAQRYWIVAVVATSLVALALFAGGLKEKGRTTRIGESATRLTSFSSARYHYWRVGLRAFRQHPVKGIGSGGFRVYWLRERPISATARDVHSLELEMAAELGVVGLLALGLMIAGIALAARQALRRHPAMAAGWCAAAIVWLVHASIDWDWELPAVTLPFLILAGALVALAEASPEGLAEPQPSAHEHDQHVVAVGA